MSDNNAFKPEENNGFAEPPKKRGTKAMIILETDKLVYYMAILMFVGLCLCVIKKQ